MSSLATHKIGKIIGSSEKLIWIPKEVHLILEIKAYSIDREAIATLQRKRMVLLNFILNLMSPILQKSLKYCPPPPMILV